MGIPKDLVKEYKRRKSDELDTVAILRGSRKKRLMPQGYEWENSAIYRCKICGAETEIPLRKIREERFKNKDWQPRCWFNSNHRDSLELVSEGKVMVMHSWAR